MIATICIIDIQDILNTTSHVDTSIDSNPRSA